MFPAKHYTSQCEYVDMTALFTLAPEVAACTRIGKIHCVYYLGEKHGVYC